MYRALITDFDGTLVDTQRAIAAVLLTTFKERGIAAPAAEAIQATISMGITLEETIEALHPELRFDANKRGEWCVHYRRIYNAGLGVTASAPFPGVAHTLDSLCSMGIPIIVVSNKGEAAIRNTLQHFALDHLVTQIIAASGELPTKPNPDSFLMRILPKFEGLKASDFLVFGDTETDMKYARAIGAGAAYASYGYGNAEACLAYEPDLFVHDVQALLAAFACLTLNSGVAL